MVDRNKGFNLRQGSLLLRLVKWNLGVKRSRTFLLVTTSVLDAPLVDFDQYFTVFLLITEGLEVRVEHILLILKIVWHCRYRV